MALQKVFKESYVKQLRDKVRAGIELENYALEGDFPYDKTMVSSLAGIEQPIGLEQRLDPNPTGDFKSAVTLYEAYPNLSPVMASNENFWIYLTHADCFHYTQKRWPEVLNGKADSKYIENHWFLSERGFSQTTLAWLWWAVHLTLDPGRSENRRYELTEFLFEKNYIKELLSTRLIRHKEAVIGITEFLMDNEDVSSGLYVRRIRFIKKYFNQLGAVKQLAYLNRNFFYKELLLQKDNILNAKSQKEFQEEFEGVEDE